MRIGSVWLSEDKNGNKCFTGEIDLVFTKLKIGIFKNTEKEEGTKQPDYRVVKLEDRPRDTVQESDSTEVPF